MKIGKRNGNNHSHVHHHIHNHENSNNADKNILTAFFLNLFFVVIEIAGGFFTGSYAIVSDAFHDFGDCLTIGCAYLLEKISSKKADSKYTYGYRRYSLLSAIITSLVLVIGSIIVIAVAVMRFKQPHEVNGAGMMIIAVIGVIINGAAVLKTSKGRGANEKAINLHLLEDSLGWLAVLVGSMLICFFKWHFVDGVLSICIAVFILVHSMKNLISVFSVLLEKAPSDFSVDEYRTSLEKIKGVSSAGHIHVWSLDGEKTLATVCLEIFGEIDNHRYNRIKTEAEALSREAGINHLIIQMDLEKRECGEN